MAKTDPISLEKHQQVIAAVWAHRKARDGMLGIIREYKKRDIEPGPRVQAQLDMLDQQRMDALKIIETNMNELVQEFDDEIADAP